MSQDSVATPPPAPADLSLPTPPAARPAWLIPAAALGAGIAIGAVATLALRGGEEETAAAVAPAPVERGIALPEALAQRAGIEVAPVVAEPVVPTIEIVGNVDFDPARIADVGGRLEGRVVEVHVELGDTVEEGDPLVSIEGPDLGQAIAELLEARAELAAATSQAERQTALRRDQLTTATAVEQASAERAALQARVRGAEQHLAALGLAPGSITAASRGRALPRTITLRAPIAGEVVERQVHLGAVVDPTHPLVRIADLSSVWIVLNMFENDLGRVREGDRVEITSESYPDELLSGNVAHVGVTVDETTRTADVRVVVDNADRRLRPGQFVHATLHVSSEARNEALLLPQSAISQIAGQPGVFVRLGENRYDVRPLELGHRYGTRVEIVRGLAAGDEVVVEGAFALKSELER
jgi:cobalt-zinc-cadmium efflux system membrane fusion protein